MIEVAAQQLEWVPLSHDLLENKRMVLLSNLRIFLQRLFKLESKYTEFFPDNLSSYEWICDPFVPPTGSFTLARKNYIDLACDDSLKRNFISGNLTNFWISLMDGWMDGYPDLAKRQLRMAIPFATSYLCEAAFLPSP